MLVQRIKKEKKIISNSALVISSIQQRSYLQQKLKKTAELEKMNAQRFLNWLFLSITLLSFFTNIGGAQDYSELLKTIELYYYSP